MEIQSNNNLRSVWRQAGELPRGVPGEEPDSMLFRNGLLIQDERRIRIFLAHCGEQKHRCVTKIYRTPLLLTWRDLFRVPVAERESRNLKYAEGRKLPVVASLGHGVQRTPGTEWFSLISTAFLDGDTMRAALARPGITGEERSALVEKSAEMLALMHQEGLIWGTAHTGNFMVSPQPGGVLTAFDLPYAVCTQKDMRSSGSALYDLHTMVRDFRRLCGLEEVFIDEFFSAYARAAGREAGDVRAQFETRLKNRGFTWSRIWLRTLSSFRLRP